MKVLVIGYGSIGARHARILKELGHEVAVVSQHGTEEHYAYTGLAAAFQHGQPDYVVITNRTFQHYSTLEELVNLNFFGNVMIEKPLFHRLLPIPSHQFRNVVVAYNLRFHPLLQRLKALLNNQKILTAHAYVGQYLPDWRPGQDYQTGYSTKKAEGGGVLRDLSHEMDYLIWLLGSWSRVVAVGGHYSKLAGDSDDVFGLLIEMKKCPITMLHLNYLDRIPRREVIVNTDEHTYLLNLVQGTLQIDGNIDTHCEIDADYTYRLEHTALLEGQQENVCSMDQGLEILSLIHGAEQSILHKGWIDR
jgi:predicted dehydrogenase